MAAKKNKGGRPTAFRKEYPEMARKMCLLGATDKELADVFEVSEQTVNTWKTQYPKFLESIKLGKEQADAAVADRLYQRALGYSHPEVHVSNYQGQITLTKLTKHYPPDSTAAIFWLKNRRTEGWRDRHDVQHSGKISLGEFLEELE